jgi:hypothetical protein
MNFVISLSILEYECYMNAAGSFFTGTFNLIYRPSCSLYTDEFKLSILKSDITNTSSILLQCSIS